MAIFNQILSDVGIPELYTFRQCLLISAAADVSNYSDIMFILLHVLNGQLGVFCSTVDWALSLFYKFNCWVNRYFEERKKNGLVRFAKDRFL
jgi:hypothetical protein